MSFSATEKGQNQETEKDNSDEAKKPEFQLGDQLSLTEISEILTSQDSILQKTLISSQELFSNFIVQFNELQSEMKAKSIPQQQKPRV